MSDKTTADTKLLSWCPSKIKEFKGNISIGRPYVWELRLSAEDFNALEQKLKESISSHNNDHRHLICEEFALYVVIYLAEWYKRFYKGREILDENKAERHIRGGLATKLKYKIRAGWDKNHWNIKTILRLG